jgi:NADH-quinone oxidoreductase subunit M
MLTLTIFIPILTALVVLLIPSSAKSVFKGVAVAGSLVTLALASWMCVDYLTPADQNTPTLKKLFQDDLALAKASTITGLSEAVSAPAGATKDQLRGWSNAERVVYARGREGWLVVDASRTQLDTNDAKNRQINRGADKVAANIRYVDRASWIEYFNINYLVGVDGLSLPLLALTALLGPICLVYSWTIDKGAKAYFALFLLLQSGLMGVFCAMDFFLFYVFWEVVLLPMYFLIGIWGGPRRVYASIKFFIYTLVGSVLMLIAMLALYFTTGADAGIHTFNLLTIHSAAGGFAEGFQYWIFLGLFFGFAIKVPIFPFHTWLPDAHVEAPTAISVILAGVLLKMGGYGFFRMSYPFAPDVFAKHFTLLIGTLGLINLVYGAMVAMAQTDFKKLVAYSSVSHMGYVMLGLAAFTHGGVQGSALQMINHGVSSALMFLLVGVVYDRAHHRDLNRFGGLALKMPIYASLAMIGFFASLGLPGLNGFISEAMVFLGMWDPTSYLQADVLGEGISYRWMIFAALPGIVLTAAYILWTIQRVFMGTVREDQAHFPDLNWRELVAIVPLAILCIVLGVYPNLVLQYLDPTLKVLVEAIRGVA